MLGRDFNSRGMETCRGSTLPALRFMDLASWRLLLKLWPATLSIRISLPSKHPEVPSTARTPSSFAAVCLSGSFLCGHVGAAAQAWCFLELDAQRQKNGNNVFFSDVKAALTSEKNRFFAAESRKRFFSVLKWFFVTLSATKAGCLGCTATRAERPGSC